MRKSECKFYVTPDKRTICVYKTPWGSTYKGIAKLAPGDTYDEMKGQDIAFLKCKIRMEKEKFNSHKKDLGRWLRYYIEEMVEMDKIFDKIEKYQNKIHEIGK